MFTQNVSNERMQKHTNGFIGFGTSNPGALLHVSGTTVIIMAWQASSWTWNVVGNIIG